jgi:hypothetical protein
LVIAQESVPAAIEAFEGAAIEPAIPASDWFCRWWGRAWFGARVEWVGGVTDLADQPLPTDFGPIAASRLEQVEWQGLKLRVPPASLQREVNERRGLHDRTQMLDRSGLLV